MKEEGDPYEHYSTLYRNGAADCRRRGRAVGARSGLHPARASAQRSRFCADADLGLVTRTGDHAGWADASTTTAGDQACTDRWPLAALHAGSRDLLQRVLEQLSAEQMEVEPVEIALLKPLAAVMVEDSTSIVLPPEFAEVWRGCGGSVGMSEAAIKLFVRWDVLTGELQGPGLEQGRRNDKRGPLAVEDLPEGSLYVADLGFFGVQRLTQVAGRTAGRRASASASS